MNALSQNLCRTQSWGKPNPCLQETYILIGERNSKPLIKFKHFLFINIYSNNVNTQNHCLKHQEKKWISYEFYKGHNPADQSYIYLPGIACVFFSFN